MTSCHLVYKPPSYTGESAVSGVTSCHVVYKPPSYTGESAVSGVLGESTTSAYDFIIISLNYIKNKEKERE